MDKVVALLKETLRPIVHSTRVLHLKYFGDVGYLSRLLHLRYAALRERKTVAMRREVAARNSARAGAGSRIIASALQRDGYHITSVSELGLSPAVIDYCRRLTDPKMNLSLEEVQSQRSGRGKAYWLDLYHDVSDEQTPVTDFIGSREIIDICSMYLGQVPFVHELSLYFTPPGAVTLPASMQGSLNWHLDNDRPHRIKIFMLPYGADEEAGATMFVPKTHAPLNAYKNFPGYFDDRQFREFGLDPQKIVHFTGSPGAVLFFDTSRLFHCGSRTKSKPRAVLNVDLSPVTSYMPYRYLKNGPLRRPRFAKLNENLLR